MSADEKYECLDCFSVAPLNQHGRCSRCLSDAVISERKLTVRCKHGIEHGERCCSLCKGFPEIPSFPQSYRLEVGGPFQNQFQLYRGLKTLSQDASNIGREFHRHNVLGTRDISFSEMEPTTLHEYQQRRSNA